MQGKCREIAAVVAFLIVSWTLSGMPVLAAEKKAKERLAVLELDAKHGVEQSFALALSVIVRDKLHSSGDYQVMSKEDIQAVASREQLLQAMGGCDDAGSQCLVDFGRTIGTRFMVAGDVSKLGSTYTVSLRMLDTKGEGAGVVNRVSESCKCTEDALIVTVQDVAAKLIGKPTSGVAAKKTEEETKKLAEEKRKAEEIEKQRLAAEKKKIEEAEQQRQEAIAAERRKVEQEKQRIVAEIEKLKKEKEQAAADAEQKRIAELLRMEDEGAQKKLTGGQDKYGLAGMAGGAANMLGKPFTDPTTGMEFLPVPAGCFQMGQTMAEEQHLLKTNSKEEYDTYFAAELPRHESCVDGFLMGKFEVTVGQWRKFFNTTGYRTDAEKNTNAKGCRIISNGFGWQEGSFCEEVGFSQTDLHPVVCVSHNDAVAFAKWLSKASGRTYRLPTEAEWEYAARAGTKTSRYWGDDEQRMCQFVNSYDRSWDSSRQDLCDDGYEWSSPVGSYQPNNFGLYDMLGNAYEWTADWYSSNYYDIDARQNPQGVSVGLDRVLRGGGWYSMPGSVRAAHRSGSPPWDRSAGWGFRLVLVP